MRTSRLSWVGYIPRMTARNRDFKQERAGRTHAAILDAAAAIFPRLGYEKTQTPEIARVAGISTGAVYRYFDDKRQIFLEMLDRELARARAEVQLRLGAIAATGAVVEPREVVARVVDAVFESARKDAALTRVFFALSLTDPDVAALRARADDTDRIALAALIEQLIPRDVVPSPMAAAMVVQVAAVGVALEIALREREGEPSEADVKATLRDMLVGLLFPARPQAATTATKRKRSKR
jgi:AcrR family transcriptional regulator